MRTTYCSYKNSGCRTFTLFMFEKFAVSVPAKNRALFAKLFHKNNDCAPISLQKFRTLKGQKKSCWSDDYAEKIIQKFEMIVSFEVKSGRKNQLIQQQLKKWPQ